MSKFYGKIGFGATVEVEPGRWDDDVVEKDYVGDILNISKKWREREEVNDNLEISQRVSIICDLYASSNLKNIKYVEWKNTKWKVVSVEFKSPRLILTLGGVYNE